MAEVIPSEIALTLLEVLVQDVRMRAGEVVPDLALKASYQGRGGHVQDIKVGLEYAHSQGWLEYDSGKQRFTLTDAGYAEG